MLNRLFRIWFRKNFYWKDPLKEVLAPLRVVLEPTYNNDYEKRQNNSFVLLFYRGIHEKGSRDVVSAACVQRDVYIDRVYSVKNSWDDISQTLSVNSPVYAFITTELPLSSTELPETIKNYRGPKKTTYRTFMKNISAISLYSSYYIFIQRKSHEWDPHLPPIRKVF